MSLLSETSRTVVNAQTYTGPGGSISSFTSDASTRVASTAVAPAYIQRGALTHPAGGKVGMSSLPAFSYSGSTMVLPNILPSGAAQMLVYTQAADKTYSVSSILPIADTNNANFCVSAISYDGTVCVFGNQYDGANNGKMIVFRLINSVWTRIFTASGATGSFLACSVSISADGATIAVGALGQYGFVNIYSRRGNVVVLQQTVTGLAAGMDNGGYFGRNCALSGNGSTLVVGAPYTNAQFGSVVTYKLLNNVWSQQSILVPVGLANAGATPEIGYSVSVDYDGVTLAIGCFNGSLQRVGGTGCVVVYTIQAGAWEQNQTIIPFDVQTSPDPSLIGYQVSMASNGQAISFDGYDDFGQQGGAWIFTRQANGLWSANGNKRVGTGYTITTGVPQQYGAIMSPDASVVAVLSDTYNNAGEYAFWIFA